MSCSSKVLDEVQKVFLIQIKISLYHCLHVVGDNQIFQLDYLFAHGECHRRNS